MNFQEAIERHIEWKLRFRSAIEKHEQFDIETVRRDDCCVLGRWIHGEGRFRHGNTACFGKLLQSHAQFHAVAGEIAGAINRRAYDDAHSLMGPFGKYAGASIQVIAAINDMESAVAKSAA